MNSEQYTFQADDNYLKYVFFSIGKKGIIAKVVLYEQITENVYNLAFGDYDYINQTIDDQARTDNGDTIKVLATVIQTVKDFFEKYPQVILQIQGNTATRTRLYQKIIRDNLKEIEKDFRVFALKKGERELEKPNFEAEYDIFYLLKNEKNENR